MELKGVFAGRPAVFQLALLLFFVLTGVMLASLATLLFAGNAGGDIYQNPGMLRLFQFLSAICTFLFPVLLVAWLCSHNPSDYLFADRIPDVRTVLLTLVSMFLFSPTITLTGYFNEAMKLPASLEAVEKWMQSLEESAQVLTDALLSGTDAVSVIMNLLVIAVTAAITEELFFRGALQRIVGQWFSNHHVVIWSVAFLFSAIHMQFYGFLPRLLLGVYFGYLLYWSKSIWVPVTAHFCNNAVAVIGMANTTLKDNEYISGEIPDSELIPFVIVSAITFVLFCLCANQIRVHLKNA